MHVVVAIVAFRNSTDIVKCLGALECSSYPDFEVIICENGGLEAYQALAAIIPPFLKGDQKVHAVLAARNLGYGGGVNLCIRTAPAADAWWVLNPDTLPAPGAMAALVNRLAAGDCDAVGGTIYLPNRKVQLHGGMWRPWLARAVSIGYGAALEEPVQQVSIERSQNYISGASMMIGRRFLETVGPMREDYFLYCEEVEWCLRGNKRGMRLGFTAEAIVLHKHGTTTGAGETVNRLPAMPVFLGERNKMLLTRDCFPRRMLVAATAAFLLILLRYARQRAWRQLGYAVSGWKAGILNKRGMPQWASK